jgi:hypothetical protein
MCPPESILSIIITITLYQAFTSLKVFQTLFLHFPNTRSSENPKTIKMHYTSVILALAASAVALPNVGPSPKGGEVGKAKQEPFWPTSDVSVEEAKAACGNDNQIACCDDTTLTGDQVEVESGPLAGALKNLLGGKNGAKGLGLFDKCSKLNLDRKILFFLFDPFLY